LSPAPVHTGYSIARLTALLAALLLVVASPPGVGAEGFPDEPPKRTSWLPDDVQLGLEVAVALSEGIGTVEDESWHNRLGRIGYRVAAISDDRDTPYSFAILDLPEPNAMALPGGFIFVTRGMMEIDLTDDELAHLLGHEIAHVRQRHFSRASRLGSILALARTALLVGILLGVSESGISPQRIDVAEDPGRRDWQVGVSGKQALLQASTVFGGVLQALFERGYSRKLEFEADEWGNRLAVAAGFASEGGPGLLERLHERSYEGHLYSYWRTHPYFADRIVRCRERAARLTPPPEPPTDARYRERLALFFAEAADRVSDETQALALFQRALRCEPSELGSLENAVTLVQFKARREWRKHRLLRCWGPLIGEYDQVIARAAEAEPPWPELTAARGERAELVAEHEELLPEQLEIVFGEAPPTGFLERFIKNYPQHPRVTEISYRLGTQYLLGGRPQKAVEQLTALRQRAPESAWADSALGGALRTVPRLEDLAVCYGLIEAHGEATDDPLRMEIASAARQRMDELIAGEISLEDGGAFLASWPESPWSDAIQRQVHEQARGTYRNGRVHEGLRDYQQALDAYYEVLTLAPEAPVAPMAEDGIERIRRLEREL